MWDVKTCIWKRNAPKDIIKLSKQATHEEVKGVKKRIVSVLLTAAMAVSVVACGSSEDEQKQNAAAEAGGEDNLYGYDNPVNIKIGISYPSNTDFQWYGDETVTDNAWMDLYKENNIVPEILYEVDQSQAETKLSTAIMSGEYPDVFSVQGADYKNYVESGDVADITDAFEKYASDELKEYMQADNGMAMDALYMDGKLYGLPQITDPYLNCNMMFIRQDWLDNLGLDIPTTMEELKEVAHAFTYNDPDGNGKNDTYGLALDGVNVINASIGTADPIFNAFGCYLGQDGMTYVKGEDGEIVWGASDSESMKEALQFLSDMYEDGSLAKDFITMDFNQIFEEAGAGRCGIWFGPNWGGMQPAADAAKNDPNAHVVAAVVPDGNSQGGTKAYAESKPTTVYCVSSKCTNPEILIKLFNLSVKYQNPDTCSADEYNMYFGDSKNYSGWKTSIIYANPPSAGTTIYQHLTDAISSGDGSQLNTKEKENYDSIKAYMDAVAADKFDPQDPTQQRGISLYTVYGDKNCGFSVVKTMEDNERYVDAAYNQIPSEAVTNSIPTLQKLLVETIVKITTGAENVDSYDSFMETWKAMGGQDAIDEANENA